MGFPRQEYWSGLPFPSPGDLPNPGIEPRSLALEADALTSEPPGKPVYIYIYFFFLFFFPLRAKDTGQPTGQNYKESHLKGKAGAARKP